MTFPLPPDHADMIAIDQCANCRGLCPPGDVDEHGVCTDCREISARIHAQNTPKPKAKPKPVPAPEPFEVEGEAKVVNGPNHWWLRD